MTKVKDVQQTIEITRQAFYRAGLHSAWERVVAIVVQPGVEFGDDFVLPYRPEETRDLTQFIVSQPLIYEAHSTDYQMRQSLTKMVQDHFAILKIGPALTFAFREAVFALATIEGELMSPDKRSNIISVIDETMLKQPKHWDKYYRGDESAKAFKRKYSLSDRIRYYWSDPIVQRAFNQMMTNLNQKPLPVALITDVTQ